MMRFGTGETKEKNFIVRVLGFPTLIEEKDLSHIFKNFFFGPQKEKKRALDLPLSRAFARRRRRFQHHYSEKTDCDPV